MKFAIQFVAISLLWMSVQTIAHPEAGQPPSQPPSQPVKNLGTINPTDQLRLLQILDMIKKIFEPLLKCNCPTKTSKAKEESNKISVKTAQFEKPPIVQQRNEIEPAPWL